MTSKSLNFSVAGRFNELEESLVGQKGALMYFLLVM